MGAAAAQQPGGSRTHTCALTHTCMYAHTCTHARARALTHRHTHACALAHRRARAHTHAALSRDPAVSGRVWNQSSKPTRRQILGHTWGSRQQKPPRRPPAVHEGTSRVLRRGRKSLGPQQEKSRPLRVGELQKRRAEPQKPTQKAEPQDSVYVMDPDRPMRHKAGWQLPERPGGDWLHDPENSTFLNYYGNVPSIRKPQTRPSERPGPKQTLLRERGHRTHPTSPDTFCCSPSLGGPRKSTCCCCYPPRSCHVGASSWLGSARISALKWVRRKFQKAIYSNKP